MTQGHWPRCWWALTRRRVEHSVVSVFVALFGPLVTDNSPPTARPRLPEDSFAKNPLLVLTVIAIRLVGNRMSGAAYPDWQRRSFGRN